MQQDTPQKHFDPEPHECGSNTASSFLLRPIGILRSIRRADLPADLIAGLTVAAVAIPQAIAYASIAELPPHYGLYTAAVAAVVGSLWGCSRHLATGPVNATSLLVLPVLLAVATPGTPQFLMAASLVAVMAGLLRIVLALLRFGALVTLASRSVLIGFTAGAAVLIALGQMRHLLGLDIPAMPESYHTAAALIDSAGAWNQASLSIGLGTLALLIVLRRLHHRVPAALLAIAVAAVTVKVLGLDESGVRVVGAIPRSLPSPTWVATGMLPDLQMIRTLIMGATAVAALGLIEAVAASQTLARRSGDRLDPNQEFFGQGLANIASGLLSGYPCSGSFTRSALAQQSGGRTQLTGVITGVTIMAGMLLLAPYAALVPKPAIAGVLMVVAWGMVDRQSVRRVLRTSRTESAVMIITFCATLVLPLDFAVLSGVVFSLAFFVIRSSLPRVVPVVPDPTFRHFIHNPDLPVCPQLGVLNIRGPLFFGAVYHLEEELRHNHQTHPGQNNLVLRMHGVDICDLSGIEMLESTVRTYRQLGGDVFLVRPRRPVLEVMEHSGFIDETLGRDHILEQEGAIEYLFDQVLDPAVCIYECEHRVFAECQALEKHPYGIQFPPVPRHIHRHDRHVSPEIFQELVDDPDAMILDLREPAEYNQGHVPGAGLLPLRLLPEKWGELPRDRTLLLCCRSGRRTTRALYMLEEAGFTKLYGVEGGTLAWRAAGLPITGPAEETITVTGAEDFPALPVEAGRQRRAMTAMRIKNRTAKLAERLALLSTTGDLSLLRGDIERLLDQLPAARRQGGGCVHLDPKRPVLIVSDSHALRGAFHKLLQDKYVGSATNLESIVRGDLQILLLGDILHSESKSRWQAVEDEYLTEFTSAQGRSSEGDLSGRRSTDQDNSHREIGPTPSMDEEMADAFGLATMIMTLQRSIPGFYCLKGNHDNLLNSEENGNGQLLKHVSWPGEGEIARAWTLVRFGTSFAGKYAAWENSRPIFSVCNGEDDFKFVASHSEPAGPYTLAEIEERSDEVVFGLTWTRNKGRFAPDVLRNVFGREWLHARYFVSHTGSEEGIVHLSRERLVIVNKPRHLVAALVQPGTKEFEVHIVAGP